MRVSFFRHHGRGLPAILIVISASALALLAYWPHATAARAEPAGATALPAPGLEGVEEWRGARPYYAPDVARVLDPGAERLLDGVTNSIPSGLLPESLQPEREGDFKAAGAEAAGAGGWTPLARPYAPSPDPNVSYATSSYDALLDNGGRMHIIYGTRVFTAIGQPPDAPAFATRSLQNLFHATFSEGAWSAPVNITDVTGLGDSNLVYCDADPDGYLHVVYSTWAWGRDASRPPGEAGAYQHEGENLWYRYLTPGGTWSAPRQLTNFTGSWGILGADFTLQGDCLYGAFATVRNNETAPPSFRAQIGFVQGYLENWGPTQQLDVWDFGNDAGQQQPVYWPSIGVSPLGGEVAVAYDVRTVPGAPYTGKADISELPSHRLWEIVKMQ